MNIPSVVSIRLIPAVNRIGRQMIAYQGMCSGGQQRGGQQQGHLGGGVEAHPEHDPDRVHLPFLVMAFIHLPKKR
jgi:hypothetical protein